MDILPLVQFTIDPENPNSGIKAISFVESPAMESSMIFFNEEKPRLKYVKLAGYEQVITGAMLIPNKPILRYDSLDQPYFGFFTKETIKALRNKFHEEQQTANVNLDHDPNKQIDSYLIESYIIEDEHQLASVKSKGIEDVTIGTWMASYKINNPETFQQVVDGKVTGISIEAYLETFSKSNKLSNNNNQNKVETIMNKLVEKFEALLAEFKNEGKVKFEVAKIYEGTDSVEFTEVGQPVYIVPVEGERKLATEGNYILDDQRELSVDAAGNLVEIRSTSEESESEDQVPAVDSGAVAPEEEMKNVVPLAQFDAIKAELEALKAEKDILNAEIVALKAQVTKLSKAPLAKPVIKTEEKKVELSKEEIAKLPIAQQIALKNGIEIFDIKKFAKK